jgi:Asp-tRNA(Asn)/Glu-tRNA(Gln) amidotransferase A subunit family amidase
MVFLVAGSVVLALILVVYFMLRRRPLTKATIVIPISEILLNPEQIRVNVPTFHAPPISGYLLKIFSHLYYTALGKLLSRAVISSSNLDLFVHRVIPEPPTLKYAPPPPTVKMDAEVSRTILLSSTAKSSKKAKSVKDFYAAYKSGEITPLDVARAVMESIEDSDRGEKPLRASNHAQVLSMAEASSLRWKTNSPLSPLDGVPISIKEDMVIDGYVCYCGTTFVPKHVKDTPKSKVVQKLIDAGAVVIGVTNMPEFGTNSIGSSENLVHKQPRNPHNTEFFPGGSSSGCAVSVAAGLCPISLGADGGGSGRVPAAVCGAYALKLTHNLINETDSRYSFSTISPITVSPLDIAVFMDVICNYNPGEKEMVASASFDVHTLSDTKAILSGITVGVYSDWLKAADKEIADAFCRAVDKLKMLGVEIKEIKIPELKELQVAHAITAITELAASMSEDVDEHYSEMSPAALMITAMGHGFSATETTNAMKQRTRTIMALKHLFKEVDFIATPTIGCPIPRITPEYLTSYGVIDAEAIGKLDVFTFLASFCGVPAITIPIGVLNEELRLPAGLQLIAPWYQEPLLVKMAIAIEASGHFPQLNPEVCYDIIPKPRTHL